MPKSKPFVVGRELESFFNVIQMLYIQNYIISSGKFRAVSMRKTTERTQLDENLQESKKQIVAKYLNQTEGEWFISAFASQRMEFPLKTYGNQTSRSELGLIGSTECIHSHQIPNGLICARYRIFSCNYFRIPLILLLQFSALLRCTDSCQLFCTTSIGKAVLQSGLDWNCQSQNMHLRGGAFAAPDSGRHLGHDQRNDHRFSTTLSCRSGGRINYRSGGPSLTDTQDVQLSLSLPEQMLMQYRDGIAVARLRRPPKLTRSIELN